MIKQKTAKKQAEALKRILFMCHKRKMLKNPLQEQFRKALGYQIGWATEAGLGPRRAAMQPPGNAG